MIVLDTLCELVKKANSLKEAGTRIVFIEDDLVKQFGFVDTKVNLAYTIAYDHPVIGDVSGLETTRESLLEKVSTKDGRRSLFS